MTSMNGQETVTGTNEDGIKAQVRAYALPAGHRRSKPRRSWLQDPKSKLSLVLHCECSADETQRLFFGAYRVYSGNDLLDEGFVYADDADEALVDRLRQYCASHTIGDAPRRGNLPLRTRDEFVRGLLRDIGCRLHGRIVSFDLPFQLSRLAAGWTEALAKPFEGGFSFIFREYKAKSGRVLPDPHCPRIAIDAMDGKRARIGYTSARRQEARSIGSKPKGGPFRGMILDCRTAAYALSGEEYDLIGACRAFGVDTAPLEHATDRIEQARRRVGLIWELSERIGMEYARHPIELPLEHAYSPASIGKAYLTEMGIQPPILLTSPELEMSADEVMGLVMTTYYGGRAECHIRKVAVPVAYCDFKSMYPTIHILMGLRGFLTAKEILAEDATEFAQELLDRISLEDLYKPETLKDFPIVVEIQAEGDILPVRADYSQRQRGAATVGVNQAYSDFPLWWTLPDAIASKLQTGQGPRILRAIRFRPVGIQPDLQPISLLGRIVVDPLQQDIFQALVEERYRIRADSRLSPDEKRRGEQGLKAIANSTSYGIFIELNRQRGETEEVEVYGLEHFKCRVDNPELPGPFFMPISATLLTGGARLMLAMLEAELRQRGGAYAFMDTDSAAVVSTEEGGLVKCAGGGSLTLDGIEACRALSWAEVEEIRARFESLNPYDRDLIPGSILDLEEENCSVGAHGPEREQLWAYVIASKRYVLYAMYDGLPTIKKASEHGLGNYLPPADPMTGEIVEGWIAQAWGWIISTHVFGGTDPLPAWAHQLARTRLRISRPEMMDWFDGHNRNGKGMKRYEDSVKPFNSMEHVPLADRFLFSCGEANPLCLVSPASSVFPEKRQWFDIHHPEVGPYRVVAWPRETYNRMTVLGLTYGGLIHDHISQAEAKSLGPDESTCHKKTTGRLSRRPIDIAGVLHIGKEANELELVQAGLIGTGDEVTLRYERDPWELIQPAIAGLPVDIIVKATGYSRSMAYRLRRGERRPSRDSLAKLRDLATANSKESPAANIDIVPGTRT
jgi:hypothetical protein